MNQNCMLHRSNQVKGWTIGTCCFPG